MGTEWPRIFKEKLFRGRSIPLLKDAPHFMVVVQDVAVVNCNDVVNDVALLARQNMTRSERP